MMFEFNFSHHERYDSKPFIRRFAHPDCGSGQWRRGFNESAARTRIAGARGPTAVVGISHSS